ncbi:hypothetical protein NDU88_000878 [Pleurodeles waltl]|uniref:Uncharacterized protein n=1 Tax=Pleurodeles waltl TaxID=8319 RepID=A0AAV7P698_PLEWA|nr:hypothetical protein NDU88_000878 [Pleurodeles waltl]
MLVQSTGREPGGRQTCYSVTRWQHGTGQDSARAEGLETDLLQRHKLAAWHSVITVLWQKAWRQADLLQCYRGTVHRCQCSALAEGLETDRTAVSLGGTVHGCQYSTVAQGLETGRPVAVSHSGTVHRCQYRALAEGLETQTCCRVTQRQHGTGVSTEHWQRAWRQADLQCHTVAPCTGVSAVARPRDRPPCYSVTRWQHGAGVSAVHWQRAWRHSPAVSHRGSMARVSVQCTGRGPGDTVLRCHTEVAWHGCQCSALAEGLEAGRPAVSHGGTVHRCQYSAVAQGLETDRPVTVSHGGSMARVSVQCTGRGPGDTVLRCHTEIAWRGCQCSALAEGLETQSCGVTQRQHGTGVSAVHWQRG